MDLFVLQPGSIGDYEEYWVDEPSDDQSIRTFFLGLGGRSLVPTSSKQWNLRWIVKANHTTVTSFDFGWNNLPHQLVTRDNTLRRKRVKSAKIVVGSSEMRETVQAEIELLKKEDRGRLTAACASS